MKQIEKEMANAFNAGREMNKSNTRVYKLFGRWLYVSLWGNDIACKDLQTGEVSYSCAGWETSTTASRLRALGAPCQIKNFQMIRTDTGAAFPATLADWKN